ncbi:hypothetical protein Ciccas_005864 [Cichlidogyrus casuarinus]|uniref:Uncharacterized protein n=1 Tax=Cichlidogyrus casuarinus TaxID=1844966 RepID=A0ABD2Q8J6_9PLAT
MWWKLIATTAVFLLCLQTEAHYIYSYHPYYQSLYHPYYYYYHYQTTKPPKKEVPVVTEAPKVKEAPPLLDTKVMDDQVEKGDEKRTKLVITMSTTMKPEIEAPKIKEKPEKKRVIGTKYRWVYMNHYPYHQSWYQHKLHPNTVLKRYYYYL